MSIFDSEQRPMERIIYCIVNKNKIDKAFTYKVNAMRYYHRIGYEGVFPVPVKFLDYRKSWPIPKDQPKEEERPIYVLIINNKISKAFSDKEWADNALEIVKQSPDYNHKNWSLVETSLLEDNHIYGDPPDWDFRVRTD